MLVGSSFWKDCIILIGVLWFQAMETEKLSRREMEVDVFIGTHWDAAKARWLDFPSMLLSPVVPVPSS